MSSTINASTASGGGLVTSADASGILQLQTAGVTALTIDGSQNVGIGTSSPAAKLDVAATIRSTANVTPTSGSGLEIIGGSSSNFIVAYNRTTPAFLPLELQSSIFTVATAGSERMRIDSSGNVGIGTSSPVTSLTVQAGAGNGIKVYDPVGGSAWPCIEAIGTRSDGNATFGGRFGAGSRKNDGIAIPTGWLLGQYAFGGQWGTDTTYNQTKFLYSASVVGVSEGSFTSATAMPTALVFSTGSTGTSLQSINVAYGTERMRIDSSGNLLVGTTAASTSPTTGFTFNPQTIGAYAAIGHSTSAGSGSYFISFGYNGGVIGTITQNGTTGVLYNVSSDQRLKTNVQPAGSAIQSILDFPVDQFDWISDSSHQDFGGVAQKILKVIPEMVSVPENHEEMMGVDWSKAVPRLIKTIQELKAIIDTQNARIEALEGVK